MTETGSIFLIGPTQGVIARWIIAECGTECLIRGRVALLWSLRKSSGLRLVWRDGAVSESAKKQGASSFSFLPATPCQQPGFCSVLTYDVTDRTGVCPLAPVLPGWVVAGQSLLPPTRGRLRAGKLVGTQESVCQVPCAASSGSSQKPCLSSFVALACSKHLAGKTTLLPPEKMSLPNVL